MVSRNISNPKECQVHCYPQINLAQFAIVNPLQRTEGGGAGTYPTSQLRIGQQQDPKQQHQQSLPAGMQHISYAPSRPGGYVNQFHPPGRGGSSHTQRMAPQPRPNMSLMGASYSVPQNPMVQTYIPGAMPGQVIVPSNMAFPQPTRHQSHGSGTPNAGPTPNFMQQNCSFYIQNPPTIPSYSHYPPAMYSLPVRSQQTAQNSTQYSQQQQQSQAVPQLMANPQNQGIMTLSMPPAQVSAMGMQQQQQLYQPTKEKKKRRENALPIFDPTSGIDITEELYQEKELKSGDSAASPQPLSIQEEAAERAYIASQIASKVAAEFASKVAVAVSSNNPQNADELAPNGPTSRSVTPPAPVKVDAVEPQPPAPKPTPEPVIPTVSAKTNSPTVELHRPQPVPKPSAPPVSSTHFVQHNPPPHVAPITQPQQAPSPPLQQRPPSPQTLPTKIDPVPRQPSPPRKPAQPQFSEPKPKRKDDKKRDAPRPAVQQPPPSTSPALPKRDPSPPKKTPFVEPAVTRASPTPPPSAPTPPPPATEDKDINGEADPEAVGKALQRPKQKKKHLNKKGDEKEGTDMDAFVALAEPQTITPEIEDKPVETPEETPVEVEAMVAAKNEENLTNNVEPEVDENVIESMTIERSAPALQFNYKDGQWSPINQDGKKVYDRDFLMEVRRHPLSTKKPQYFAESCDLFRDRPNDMSNRKLQSNSMNLSRGDNSPSFLRASSSQRGPLQNKSRNMGGPGRMGPGGSIGHNSFSRMQKPGGYSSMNSYRDEVQLHTVANSWKPTRFLNNNSLSEEEVKTENLLKTMRGILNKLTPQKFSTLLGKVDKLEIDNEDRLGKVVTLVFEKAIDEPSFSSMYAELCYNIQNKKVPVHENKEKEEGPQTAKASEVMFRKVLLSRCQDQFEKTKGDQLDIATRTSEIQETKDPEKKKELKLALDEDERKIRVKAVGLVRFIGELYKKQMLTLKIMHECIGVLLAKIDEEPLECLCKLLTTVGKDLEQKSGANDLNDYFATMIKLSQKSSDSKISSRIRFMLQDVIDLRANKWIPRRDENKPKTIEQIQKDAERETIMESSNFYAPSMSSGGGNRGKHTNDDRRRPQKNQINEDGWSSVHNKSNIRSYQFDSNKLINMRGDSEVEELGTASKFSAWSAGASAKKPDNNKQFSNKYAILRGSDDEKKMSNASSSAKKMTPSPSVEKERMMAGVRHVMRSGSGPSSRDSSRQRYTGPATSLNSERDERPPMSRETNEKPPQIELISDDILIKKLKVVLEEWFTNRNVEETIETIQESFPGPNLRRFIHRCLEHIIENLKPEKMANFSKLLVILIKDKIVPKKDVVDGFSEIMANEDLVIDLPLIWVYLSHFLVPLIAQEAFDFRDVMTAAKSTKKENLSILIVEIITSLIREKGPSWIRTQWEACQVHIMDFIPDNVEKDKFLQEKGIGFVFGCGECSMKPVDSLASRDIEEKLISFLSLDSNKAFDHACDWIKVNVPDSFIKSEEFVKVVTRAAIKCSIVKEKFCPKSFDSNKNLIIKFVDNDEKRELACLSALEHLLTFELVNILSSTMICEIFDMLYNAGTISHDGFMKWKSIDSDGAIQTPGRGVLMKILPPFFVMLSESINDTEEES